MNKRKYSIISNTERLLIKVTENLDLHIVITLLQTEMKIVLYHSQIRLCVKWTYNVHIYITKNIGISKHEKHDFSVQVRNFLLPLSLKVLRHKEGERHNLSMLAFSSAPRHLARYPPKASASKRKSTLFVRCPVLNSTNFLQIPKILRALPVCDVIRTL